MPPPTVNLENEQSALLLQCHLGLMGSDPSQVASSSVKLFQNSEIQFFLLLLSHRMNGISYCPVK